MVAAAFCGLVLVFGSKLVSYDAASLPFGMVSEPRRRLDPTPAGSLVILAVKNNIYRVSAEFLELCLRALTLDKLPASCAQRQESVSQTELRTRRWLEDGGAGGDAGRLHGPELRPADMMISQPRVAPGAPPAERWPRAGGM